MGTMSGDIHLPVEPAEGPFLPSPPLPLPCEGCHNEQPSPPVRLAFVGPKRDIFFLCADCAASAGATYPTPDDYAHQAELSRRVYEDLDLSSEGLP